MAAAFVLAVSGPTQIPREAAPTQADRTGRIAGVVVSDSGSPLARARVALSAGTTSNTVTDERGGFLFANLPPGEYTLSVSRIGYLDVAFGQRQPGSGRSGTPIRLEAGQRIDRLALSMPRGGVLTGVVLDENGEPAITVPVRAYRWRIRRGEPALAAASFDQTDDRGVYRIPFLAPGDYTVAATPRTEIDALQLAATPSSPASRSYAPVFHPGTTQASEAAVVRVGISEERSNVDIRLQHVTTGRISGVVIGPGGGPQSGVQVSLGPSSQWLASAGTRAVRSGSNGQFTFRDVPPGPHVLTAHTDGGAASWGRADVATDGRDLSGVQIVLQRGMSVTGTVTVDGGAPASGVAGVRLLLTPIAPSALGGSVSAAVQRDATFALRNVPPGRYQLSGVSLPAGQVLATAIIGGRDVLDAFLEVRPNEDLTGVVTISPQSTEIAGSLVDAAGRPVFDQTILAFAAEARYWTYPSRRIQTTRPTTSGRFVLRGLPPGGYRLVAIPDVEPGQEFDPEFLQQILAESDAVSLAEGEHRVHTLTLKSR